MRSFRPVVLAFSLLAFMSMAPALAYSPADLHFGGQGNWRQMPTTGTVTGTYYHHGNFTQTGPLTANEAHLICDGTVTLNNAITVVPGVAYQNSDTTTGSDASGDTTLYTSGGAHAGAGGKGGRASRGVFAYTTVPDLLCQMPLYGMAGYGGLVANGQGGFGGGGFYVEARGNIVLTSAAAITANGAQPANPNGSECQGSGAGGGVDLRAMGSITLNSGSTITANGANGHTATLAGGGGGGGFINVEAIGGVTNSGTQTANGGSSAATGGLAGAAGVVQIGGNFHGPRTGCF